jgi:UDP-2-acetamido-3-amino-2,3-dideoxy-glucuronate N-acetyltransferase
MNVGVAGIGYWGKNLLRNLSEISNVAKVCHTGAEQNREWVVNAYPDVEVVRDVEAFCSSPELNAIVVATPIGTHYEIARRALEEQKDVFVEKPPGTSVAQTRELDRIADEMDCTLFVGYIFVHHPLVRSLSYRIEGHEIETAKFTWMKSDPGETDLLFDLVTHPVSVLHRLFGEGPTRYRSISGLSFTDAQDTFESTMTFGNSHAEILVDRFSPEEFKAMTVRLADGTVYVWTETALYEVRSGWESRELIEERTEEPLLSECHAFLDAAENGGRSMTNGRFAIGVQQTLADLRNYAD